MHHFPRTLFDTLGDDNFAFAGQQLNGTHFAHIHAHWVGGAPGIGFNRRQCRGGLFGRVVIGILIAVGKQQLIGIGSLFEDFDADIVDHCNDVFHLVGRINFFRQMVVHFGKGQVTLFFAFCDQFF